MSASMNQLLQAMNRPDEGALYWDNLAVYITIKKIYLLTRICDGQKRKEKKNLKKSRQLMRYLKHSMISGPTQGQAPASHPPPLQRFEKKRKEKKYTFSNKKNL